MKPNQLFDRGRTSAAGEGVHHRLDEVDVLGLHQAHRQGRHFIFGGEPFEGLPKDFGFFRRLRVKTGSSHGLDEGFDSSRSARSGDAVGPQTLLLRRGCHFEALNQR